MKIKKAAKKLTKNIKHHYACHGVPVKLEFESFDVEAQRFIFSVRLKPGTTVNSIFERAQDVGAALQMPLFQPFWDEQRMFLAVSRYTSSECSLLKILRSNQFCEATAELPVALGYDLMGRMVVDDLSRMPHALYVGATNSGKSTGLVTLITSLVCGLPADELSLVLVDVGGRTMQAFEGIPHLSCPVVKHHDQAVKVLSALKRELDRRIELAEEDLSQAPRIVCVIDEFVSFLDNTNDRAIRQDLRTILSDLLRRGRGVKIHMVLATQDPKRDSMGVDIGNITARMAFRCAKYQTSINVLNVAGAEKLKGKGAFLYVSNEHSVPLYIQGAFMTDKERSMLISRIKDLGHSYANGFVIEPSVDVAGTVVSAAAIHAESCRPYVSKEELELSAVIQWALTQETVSASQIKAEFSMGNRANAVLEQLVSLGLVSEKFANKARKVLVRKAEDLPAEAIRLLEATGRTAGTASTALVDEVAKPTLTSEEPEDSPSTPIECSIP